MKLAEALIDRASCQRAIEQIQERLKNIALVQEGEDPVESPQELLNDLRDAYDRLAKLVQRINRTNSQTEVGPGQTLTDLLAERDVLKKRHLFLHDFATTATPKRERYQAGHVKYKASVSVPEIRKIADAVAAEFRMVEVRVQEINWKVELLD
ncbi:MAG: DIP1984 family protein [Fimbriimonadales bacterium]